jgi:hypothetical protein
MIRLDIHRDGWGVGGAVRAFIVIPMLLVVASCAGPIQTRVDSAGVAAFAPTTFMVDANNQVENSTARTLSISALEKKGLILAPAGQLLMQVTTAERSADLALSNGKAMLSPRAGKKRCAKKEYRVGIVLTRISDGAEIYRAHAGEFHCTLTLDAVLPALVDAAVADIGNPRGSYVVKRRR